MREREERDERERERERREEREERREKREERRERERELQFQPSTPIPGQPISYEPLRRAFVKRPAPAIPPTEIPNQRQKD